MPSNDFPNSQVSNYFPNSQNSASYRSDHSEGPSVARQSYQERNPTAIGNNASTPFNARNIPQLPSISSYLPDMSSHGFNFPPPSNQRFHQDHLNYRPEYTYAMAASPHHTPLPTSIPMSHAPQRPQPQPVAAPTPTTISVPPTLRSLTPDNILDRELPQIMSFVAAKSKKRPRTDSPPPVPEAVPKKSKPAKKKSNQRADGGGRGGNGSDSNDEEGRKGRGRTKDALQYSTRELRILVDLVQKWLPIGGKAWDRLLTIYNKEVVAEGFPARLRKPLQARYNNLMKQATEKPTGDAERKQIYLDALKADRGIQERVSIGDIQDDDENSDVPSLIELSSDDDDDDDAVRKAKAAVKIKLEPGTKSKGKEKGDGKGMLSTVLTKAY